MDRLLMTLESSWRSSLMQKLPPPAIAMMQGHLVPISRYLIGRFFDILATAEIVDERGYSLARAFYTERTPMPDIFISFTKSDSEIAHFLHKHLTSEKLDVFLAPISIAPGDHWREEILDNLQESNWLLFLASKKACKSAYVQQELAAASGLEKNIVPILWDMPPEDLPGWVDQKQALDFRGLNGLEINIQVKQIAKKVKADIRNGYLIVGFGIAAIAWLGRKK